MRKLLPLLSVAVFTALGSARAEVWINEVLPNAPGTDTGNEYFELRGTPNMPLTNYYLLSLEGQGNGKGDVNQYFDLTTFSLGPGGYLFARQAGSQFEPVHPGATLIENTIGTGWGQVNGAGSTVGHYSDSAQLDLENSATTMLLVNIGTGQPPTLTLDLDIDNDGFLDLPEGWVVVDSVGMMDGSNAAETDMTYGAINFRIEGQPGTSAYGNIIDIPGPMTTTAGTFHVGRKGESTGSTADDWFGSILNGSAGTPLQFIFFSSSDISYSGRLVSEMIYGGFNPEPDPPGTVPYTPTIHGNRFTNFTRLDIGGPIGAVTVDPRDNSTILFTMDSALGAIYRANKVASGTWSVDPTPIVNGLDRPSGLVVQTNGTLWWLHDVAMSLVRLKEPWATSTPELVITNFGPTATDDDPIDLTFTPHNFIGSIGQPNWIVIADRGSDGDAFNALNLVDPATEELFQSNENFLVQPTAAGLGFANLHAIGALPQSGEVVTLSQDGVITAADANGTTRTIIPTTFWPLGSTPVGGNLAVDPVTGRIWVSDDQLDEVWSIDPNATGQTSDAKELSFPLTDPAKTYLQLKLHDPGMAFSANGEILVVSDNNTAAGGGRLIIFHNEPIAIPTFQITGVVKTEAGVQLSWQASGNATYVVQRSTDLNDPDGFVDISGDLSETQFTDTNPDPGQAFYRVIAKP